VRVHSHTLGLNIAGSSVVWCVYSKSFVCCVLFFAYCLSYLLILSLGRRCVISSFILLILLECYQKILVVTVNVVVFCFFAAHCFVQNWYEENIELAFAVVLVL